MKEFHVRILLCAALFLGLAACGRATPTSILEISSTESLTLDEVQVLDLEDMAKYEQGECPFRIPEGLRGERIEVQCGFLTVPEDRQETGGAKIRLPAAVYKSRGEKPQPDPLLILVGEPGPFLQFSMYFTFLLNQVYDERDLIMLEARGTGFSEPALSCPGLSTLFMETLNQDPSSPEVRSRAVELRQSCLQAWRAEGVQPATYTTAASVEDLEALRLALGIRQWNIFASGFSTRMAFELARSHPEGIRSMVLDTPIPPQVGYFAEIGTNAQRALDLLFKRCAADEYCSEAFPNVENVFYDLVDELNASPALVEINELNSGQRMNVLLTGDRLIDTVLMAMNSVFDDVSLPEVPRMITQLRNGRDEAFKTVYGNLIANSAPSDEGRPDLILCEELLQTPRDQIRQSDNRLTEQLRDYANRQLEGYAEVCDVLRMPEARPRTAEPVTSSVPTLFLTGDFTTDASPAWAELAADSFSQAHQVQFLSIGAFATASNKYRACAQGIIQAFLKDPTTKPNAACATSQEDLLWITLP